MKENKLLLDSTTESKKFLKANNTNTYIISFDGRIRWVESPADYQEEREYIRDLWGN